jgi:hypothetical protein
MRVPYKVNEIELFSLKFSEILGSPPPRLARARAQYLRAGAWRVRVSGRVGGRGHAGRRVCVRAGAGVGV